MMNSKKSSRYHVIRYMVLGLLVGGTVLSLNYTRAAEVMHMNNVKDTLPAKTSHGTRHQAAPVPPPPPPVTPATAAPQISTQVTFVLCDSTGKSFTVTSGDVKNGQVTQLKAADTATVFLTLCSDNLTQQTATTTATTINPADIQVTVNGVKVNTQELKSTRSHDVKTQTMVGNATVTVLPGQPQTFTIITQPLIMKCDVQEKVKTQLDTIFIK